jgi:Holliday junction resolvase
MLSLRELAEKGKKARKKGKRRGRKLTSGESKRIRRRGYRAERQLVKKLRAIGFKAVRIPVSAPSSEPLPDVFATKENGVFAFEVKAPRADRAYFKKAQVKKLFDFLALFDFYAEKTPVLVCKFPYRWVFRRIENPDDYTIRIDEESKAPSG